MHKLGVVFLIFLSILGCQSDSSKKNDQPNAQEQLQSNYPNVHPALIKVAMTHGLESWEKTKQIEFQFNVNHNDIEMQRHWLWDLENEQITRFIEGSEITTSTNLETADKKVHEAFINDTYWLVFPFHLLKTDAYSVELTEKASCPINENEVTEIAIQFKEIGGYTPGDLYKIYVDENYRIQSWSFHSNREESPNLVNSWENYQSFEGIQISMNRPNDTGDFEIYFNEINVQQ